jgi:hypothetical protein
MTKIRLSSFSRDGQGDRAERFRLVAFAVAEEAQTLRSVSARPRSFQVAIEARLVDRHDRAQAHRHGGELPEVRHQPRVRIGRQPAALDLLAEVASCSSVSRPSRKARA